MSISYEEIHSRFRATFDGDLPCLVVPGLFISSLKVASNKPLLEAFSITAVVNCMGSSSNTGQQYYGAATLYKEFDLADDLSFEIFPHLRPASDAISAALAQQRHNRKMFLF